MLIITLSILLLFVGRIQSQSSISFGIGLSGYQGDIPSYRISNGFVMRTHPSFSLGCGLPLSAGIEAKLLATFGKLSGSDMLAQEQLVIERNLSFRSNIFEFSGVLNLFPIEIIGGNVSFLRPFLRFGVGYFHFNPQAKLNNTWHDLQPLGTEGQFLEEYRDRQPYKLWSLSYPLGGGVLLPLKDFLLGLHFVSRITATDYLDDVSTTYVNNDFLVSGINGDVASQLADRSIEISPDGSPLKVESDPRGNPDFKDTFWTLHLELILPISLNGFDFKTSKYSKCPKF